MWKGCTEMTASERKKELEKQIAELLREYEKEYGVFIAQIAFFPNDHVDTVMHSLAVRLHVVVK
jgi:hypothetical protein